MPSSPSVKTAKCLRCGRALSSAKSIGDQMGRICRAKTLATVDLVDVSQFKDQDAARAKAAQILEDGALVPTSRHGLYTAISSDGTDKYLVDTHTNECDCRSGVKRGYCTHLVAAQAVDLSRNPQRCYMLAA